MHERVDFLKDRQILWSLTYILVVGTSIFIAFSNWAYDDPFISYRYAYNLSHGNGLVYNIGEKYLSMTSPFFVLLLAAISPLWNDFPHLANLIGAFSIAAGGLFLWDIANSLKNPITGWVALFLFPTFPLLVSTLGSETPLYIAFCLASFAFYARQKYALMAATASLATLTRPDGIIVLILLLFGYIYRVRGSISWKVVLIVAGITVPWFLFAWLYYGSPIPLTLAAKQQQGSMSISQRFAPGLATIVSGYIHHLYFQIEAGLAIMGLFALIKTSRRWLLLIAWQVLYFASYSILGVSRYFWYYAPLVPGFVVLVGLGFATLCGLTLSLIGKHEWEPIPHHRLLTVFTIFLVILFSFSQVLILDKIRKEPDARYPIYREAGEWIWANTPKNATVGTLEVGIIGYYSERYMVDFAGLLQPAIADQLSTSTTYGDAAYWAVERYHPEYLVILEGTLPVLENSYVSKQCEAVHHIHGEIREREVKLNVYSCNKFDPNPPSLLSIEPEIITSLMSPDIQ